MEHLKVKLLYMQVLEISNICNIDKKVKFSKTFLSQHLVLSKFHCCLFSLKPADQPTFSNSATTSKSDLHNLVDKMFFDKILAKIASTVLYMITKTIILGMRLVKLVDIFFICQN